MLQIRNLTKIYDGGVKALDNVSFDVPDNQFLAVIGLSGSGKSTLLRCINRLIEPTDGQILWNGEDITKASPRKCGASAARSAWFFNISILFIVRK